MCERLRAQSKHPRPKSEARQKRTRLKQNKFLRALTNPESAAFAEPEKAAVLAGYAPQSANRLMQEPGLKRAILLAMERVGITDDFLAGKLRESLDAEETKFFSHKGRVMDERATPDHNIRLKGLELAHKLRGDFAEEVLDNRPTLILKLPTPLSEEEWNKRFPPSPDCDRGMCEKKRVDEAAQPDSPMLAGDNSDSDRSG